MKLLSKLALVLLLAGSVVITGCTAFREMDSSQEEQNLAAAGFRIRMAETDEQKARLTQLTPYKVNMIPKKGGKVVYVYPDPKQNFALIGGPKEYQKFQSISVNQNIAADQLAAAQLNEMNYWDYYDGVLGPLWW
ncbi:MAG: hypothetical protein ACK5NG_10180 [Chthoniobacterales bacterium]